MQICISFLKVFLTSKMIITRKAAALTPSAIQVLAATPRMKRSIWNTNSILAVSNITWLLTKMPHTVMKTQPAISRDRIKHQVLQLPGETRDIMIMFKPTVKNRRKQQIQWLILQTWCWPQTFRCRTRTSQTTNIQPITLAATTI